MECRGCRLYAERAYRCKPSTFVILAYVGYGESVDRTVYDQSVREYAHWSFSHLPKLSVAVLSDFISVGGSIPLRRRME